MESMDYLKIVNARIEAQIREDIKSGIEPAESKYMESALACMKVLFKNDTERHGSSPFRFWSGTSLHDANKIWEDISPELARSIPETIMKYKSRKMVTEINAVSSEALISAAMKEAGLKYDFTAQTYRAKVSVKINEKHKIIIYLNYKKINDELPKAIESLKTLVATLQTMGNGISIQKIMWYDNF